MAKTRAVKESSVARLADKLKQGRGIVFADFTGLLVKDMQALRRELRKAGVYYEVVKKTLLKRSLVQAGLQDVPVEKIQGSVSLAVSESDETAPAKTLMGFVQKNDKVKVLGGVMDSSFIDEYKVKSLAALPGKQELLGRVAGSIASPLTGLLNVLQGNLRSFVQVLSQIQKIKQ